MAGCNTGGSSSSSAGATTGDEQEFADVTGLFCDTDGAVAGQWATGDVEDWSNPGETGLEAVDFDDDIDPLQGAAVDPPPGLECMVEGEGGYPDLEGTIDHTFLAHHCYTTAVHAVHVQTQDARNGAVLVMHGENDQRLWEIGSEPAAMTWHPIPVRTRWQIRNDVDAPTEFVDRCGLPDLFCSGHIQLGTGEVFIAGGNTTGDPDDGGLRQTYLFDPVAARNNAAPGAGEDSAYGWLFEEGEAPNYFQSRSPPATYDRWYPTLTALPDGRVLISGGESRAAWNEESEDPAVAASTRVLEVFDPTASGLEPVIQPLPGGADALFPAEGGVPEYPFMFVLPNGDVFYAGSENAGDEGSGEHFGQVLVVDYDKQAEDEWFWLGLDGGITSEIRGGSAVMFRPGRILKTGGLNLQGDPLAAVPLAETIDLTAYAAGERPTPEDPDPDVPPPTAFSAAAPMHYARHYHTMTLLPSGNVLVTGGNRFDNSVTGENYHNPCEVLDVRVDELPCDEGCPSVCTARNIEGADPNTLDCSGPSQIYACSVIDTVPCRDAEDCSTIIDDPMVEGDECLARSGCVRNLSDECVTTFGYDCSDILAGSACSSGGQCRMLCDEGDVGDFCGLIMPFEGSCLAEARPAAAEGMCSPANNACYAQQVAEIWDPECNVWTELGAQQHPRMYHSTALLMPDARVISMGGGHCGVGNPFLEEQVISEYFEPEYAASGAAPAFDEPLYGGALPVGVIPYSSGDALMQITVDPSVEVDHVALMKLGSVTHGFDMGQTYMRLGATSGNTATSITLFATEGPEFPFDENTAPPGHYMMFLISPEGEPSEARYVRLGATLEASYVCEATGVLAATETFCTVEPVSGTCPSGDDDSASAPLPEVDLGEESVVGFRVVTPAGSVEDPNALTEQEVSAVHALCSTACEQHFEDIPGQSANCWAAGAFEAPFLAAYPEHGVTDLIHSMHRQGAELFPPAELDCDLGLDCYRDFDEVLRPTANDRVTPAADTLGLAEEWRLSVGGEMEAWTSASGGPVSASIVGSVGYSLCADGNATGPCPFYLGSMAFELTEPLVLPMDCGDPVTHTLSSLSVRLEQPAFGMSEEGTSWQGFTPGAIVLDAVGVVDGMPFHARRANEEPLYFQAGEAWTLLQGEDGAWIEFTVPCGEESADILVWWGYTGVTVEDSMPNATNNLPTSVTCPSTVTLAKSVGDAEDDVASARWLADGVLLPPDATSMAFTMGHEMTLVVRDERGATRTATKEVVCE